jgi:hypothetical protein
LVDKNLRSSAEIARVANLDLLVVVGFTVYKRKDGIDTLFALIFIAAYAQDVFRAIRAFVLILGV